MTTFILRRLLYSIPVLFAASVLIFFPVNAIGDPFAELRLNPLFSKETIELVKERKHLNDPLVVQYGYWLKDAFAWVPFVPPKASNQFGTDLKRNEPIWPNLKRVIPHTLQLIIMAEVVALLLGIAVGVYSAIRQYSVFDYAATTFSFLGLALPVFWLALMLQIAFTQIFVNWGVRVFYTSGLNSPDTTCTVCVDRLQHLAIPAMTLCIITIAQYSRFMRASMLEVINSDYVRTARAKGLPEAKVRFKHALRNALIPLVTVSALNFGSLIGGAIITESIFQLDGMGPYFIQNLLNQDVYPVMAWLIVAAFGVILFNLVADVAYGYIDPRIRYE